MLAGVAIGLVQGLIGGGGSVLGVPALIYVVGVDDPHVAIGTSALAVAISALASLLAYVRSGHVKWRCGLAFTWPALSARRLVRRSARVFQATD